MNLFELLPSLRIQELARQRSGARFTTYDTRLRWRAEELGGIPAFVFIPNPELVELALTEGE